MKFNFWSKTGILARKFKYSISFSDKILKNFGAKILFKDKVSSKLNLWKKIENQTFLEIVQFLVKINSLYQTSNFFSKKSILRKTWIEYLIH